MHVQNAARSDETCSPQQKARAKDLVEEFLVTSQQETVVSVWLGDDADNAANVYAFLVHCAFELFPLEKSTPLVGV